MCYFLVTISIFWKYHCSVTCPKITVRKSDFAIGNVSRFIVCRRLSLYISVLTGHIYIESMIYRNLKKNMKYHERIWLRKRLVRTGNLNLNTFSDEQCMKYFSFKPREIWKMEFLIYFTSGQTSRRGYFCEFIAAEFIVVRHLSATCHRNDRDFFWNASLYTLWSVLD